MMTLLVTSGYVQTPDVIAEELLEQVLVSHPKWIDSWVAWSCNKRTAAGLVFADLERVFNRRELGR